jgi:anhydro-N-acetylmuramic acid kinase
MSGTSLDGVDLAHCTFIKSQKGYEFSIGAAETIPYPETWLKRLKSLPSATALEYAEMHTEYGRYLGNLTLDFISRNHLVAEYISSHGHTIFHNPSKHYTSQIGEGAAIAAQCGLPVICDFRTGDVAAGGQGAPLVPIGDEILFSQYDYCLNLGGFANISMKKNGKRIAFDVSPVNIILNHIANQTGKTYDENGELAAAGQVNSALLHKLNNLEYYQSSPPKSLGREWIEERILPLLTDSEISANDFACTFCEHIAIQIACCIDDNPQKQMLITGGGAFNTFLVQKIKAHSKVRIFIPDEQTVNYKEALVFAFLGLLRIESKPNSLASVTGARHDVSGGAVYLP